MVVKYWFICLTVWDKRYLRLFVFPCFIEGISNMMTGWFEQKKCKKPYMVQVGKDFLSHWDFIERNIENEQITYNK